MISGMTTFFKAFKTFIIIFLAVALFLIGLYYAVIHNTDIVLINEVLTNPSDAGWEDSFIELKNQGSTPVDLDGWKLRVGKKDVDLSGTLNAQNYRVVYGRIPEKGTITLVNGRNYVMDEFSYDDKTQGFSKGRYPDGVGAWMWTNTPTPGMPNSQFAGTGAENQLPIPKCKPENVPQELITSLGYNMSAQQYCDLYDQVMEAQPLSVRNPLSQKSHMQLQQNIFDSLIIRDKARMREDKLLGQKTTDEEITQILNSTLPHSSGALGQEVEQMDLMFRNMLADILLEGTDYERDELKEQISTYVKEKAENKD